MPRTDVRPPARTPRRRSVAPIADARAAQRPAPADPNAPGPPGAAEELVGPVLSAGPVANAIVAAIRELNDGTVVLDRGAYVRVLAPGRCLLTREAVEARLGRAFRLPQDLELVMSALRGSLTIEPGRVIWNVRTAPADGEVDA